MTRGRWIGHGMVLAGAIAVVVGALGRWTNAGAGEMSGETDGEFVTHTERSGTVVMGAVVALIAVVALARRARTGRGLGWAQSITWLVLLIVAGISLLNVSWSVDSLEVFSSEPGYDPNPGQVGWGWYLVVAGVAAALLGLVLAYRETGSEVGSH